MRLTPVRKHTAPAYPTEEYLREHPELLRLVPERWRHNRLVLAVLGAALPVILAAQSQSHVAPLFVHGDGRGAFGCVVVNPPVFLSEDEARQVIQDEARKAGLQFVPDARSMAGVTHPVTDPYGVFRKSKTKYDHTTRKDLLLDGYDSRRHVGFEYVSRDDFVAWELVQRDEFLFSTVSAFDIRGTAEGLRSGVAEGKNQDWTGLFYDPMTRSTKASKAQLRRQVRDFVQWLKAQGVI